MKDNLIVPIYIDTNALLDLLASIEGGFSLVEKITSRSSITSENNKSASTEAGTEFGIPNVLSLLKIKLGGSLSLKKGENSNEEREIERYHTYGSLLHRLRYYLENEEIVKKMDAKNVAWESIEASNFVEIKGIVRPNPLADSFRRIDRLIGIVQLVSGVNVGSLNQQITRKEGKKASVKDQITQIRQFMRGVLSDIEKDNIRTFVVDMQSPQGGSAVVLLYTNYLRDPTMTEIEHKEYRLLGKVVRKIEKNSDETIDLLRGTGLGGIGKEKLDSLLESINQAEGMNLPEVRTEVIGPALEIVPIAIFV